MFDSGRVLLGEDVDEMLYHFVTATLSRTAGHFEAAPWLRTTRRSKNGLPCRYVGTLHTSRPNTRTNVRRPTFVQHRHLLEDSSGRRSHLKTIRLPLDRNNHRRQ